VVEDGAGKTMRISPGPLVISCSMKILNEMSATPKVGRLAPTAAGYIIFRRLAPLHKVLAL
jgi:hypothetical protein